MGAMGGYFRHRLSFAHDTGGHPENAGRLKAIERRLADEDWLGLELIEAPAATAEQIERVHPAEHRIMIEGVAATGGGMIDADTIVSADSYEAALHAAGAAVAAVDLVVGDGGHNRFAFCGMRPPGHHAERTRAMGFCLFNNIAIGAAHALAAHGLERVAILDWDVHHGNGTQDIFYASDQVLFASIHQSPLYPGTGDERETGEGAGEGFTINLPVPPGADGNVFRDRLEQVALPAVRDHKPGLIMLSAGYDAHRADPLAQCELESGDYGEMARLTSGVASELDVPVVVCLEGGYAPDALAESVSETIRGFGDGPEIGVLLG